MVSSVASNNKRIELRIKTISFELFSETEGKGPLDHEIVMAGEPEDSNGV